MRASLSVSREMWEDLLRLCAARGLSLTQLLKQAIQEFLARAKASGELQ